MDGITDSIDVSLSKLRELVIDSRHLACCSPWGGNQSDTTERLNNKEGRPLGVLLPSSHLI